MVEKYFVGSLKNSTTTYNFNFKSEKSAHIVERLFLKDQNCKIKNFQSIIRGQHFNTLFSLKKKKIQQKISLLNSLIEIKDKNI